MGEWINCNDKMPPESGWYIFTDGKNISIERYKEDFINHFSPKGRFFDLENATHWMKMPILPK